VEVLREIEVDACQAFDASLPGDVVAGTLQGVRPQFRTVFHGIEPRPDLEGEGIRIVTVVDVRRLVVARFSSVGDGSAAPRQGKAVSPRDLEDGVFRVAGGATTVVLPEFAFDFCTGGGGWGRPLHFDGTRTGGASTFQTIYEGESPFQQGNSKGRPETISGTSLVHDTVGFYGGLCQYVSSFG